MANKETRKIIGTLSEIGNHSTNIPYGDLSRKRSVRTTFRLNKDTFSEMESLSIYNSISRKELIDYIVDIVQNLADFSNEGKLLLHSINNKISGQTQKADLIRKTQVISKKSLNTLNRLSKDTGLSRDQLITLALIIYKTNLRQVHKNHEKALKDINKLISKINETENALKKFLDPDDPVLMRFAYIAIVTDNLCSAIRSEIDKGVPIDPDDFAQSV
jgi:hypothetical protein